MQPNNANSIWSIRYANLALHTEIFVDEERRCRRRLQIESD